jgi:hypothetical protein
MKIEAKSKNIHIIHVDDEQEFLLISDAHWDNPHCDRELLENHLKEAVKRNAIILINGDLFCCMQGKADPRRSKDDIRPEHNNGRYLDSIVSTAVEWFKPYAKNIAVIGYGNHETGVMKNAETDLIARFVDLLNYSTGAEVYAGGYGGTIEVVMNYAGERGNQSFAIHYFHGSGGGGPVTKGVIQDQRMMAQIEGYDMTWQGHVHELYHHINMIHRYDRLKKAISIRPIHQLRTATYKEEWADGYMGFHVERGRSPKPMGGYWMKLKVKRQYSGRGPERYISAELSPCSDMY